MIVLKVKAGLGNQMFQYAFAKALALRSGTGLALDLSWFHNIDERETKREYGLKHFCIDAEILPAESPLIRPSKSLAFLFRKVLMKAKRAVMNTDHAYFAFEARPRKDAYVEGYWNSEKYFADHAAAIRQDFQLAAVLSPEAQKQKDEMLQATGEGKILIMIHVRRADYVTNPNSNASMGLAPVEYYKLAVERIMGKMIKDLGGFDKEKTIFILASDDIAWTIENVVPHIPCTYVALSSKGFKDYEELHLMSLCHHFIIANSTFSWWSAWLSTTAEKCGDRKIVIGPSRWTADPSDDTSDVFPDGWTRI